jgi:rhodanese-related sulfurtransferase
VICGSGTGSLFAAEDVQRLGYRHVRSLSEGLARWKSSGLPFEIVRVLNADERERYARVNW